MAALAFHHGVRVIQSGENPVLVTLGDTSVIGLLCTAPDATADWPLNTPVLLTNANQATTLGATGTAKDAIDSIFDQTSTKVVVVRIDEGEDAAELVANAVGDFAALTGIHAFLKAESLSIPRPKLLLAPGIGEATTVSGIASVAVTTPGTGYVDGATTVSFTHATGVGAEAEAVITAGAITSIIVTKPGVGYTGTAPVVVITGDGASGAATATVGTTMSPVIAEAMGVAEKLRAMFYADGPDGTDVAAVQARALINSKRIFFSDPRVLKSVDGVNVPSPSSPIFAGLQAKRDRERGPHWAGSNMEIAGIVGTNRGVLYGDQANYLNENRVNTIVNKNGLRAWGVWTCSSESIWQFVSVVRGTDAVNEAIELAFLEFVDRPMTRSNLDFMVWSGVAALKKFEADGLLLPGSIFKLSSDNTPADAAAGIVKFAMAFEIPAPSTDIRITAHRNIEVAYELLFNSITGEFIVAE